ncbi:MAG: undecaprenyl/decaprenyl-phosphate alpha-N-acetylglucosaminyl 1-phosphate transferase [Armatimonadetes bacterium]|nr:undecaprenyl/decaprenyl-phosphate alpha-N-acetylglucosaminyl 1-phosphate transferase [Armatimonadota bacterium]
MLTALLLSLVVALLLTWPVRALAFRIGAVAAPGGRRIHQKPTAQAGGLAIYAGFWLAVFVQAKPLPPEFPGVFWGSLLLLGICLADDIRNLPAVPRLAGQVLVAAIAFWGGVRIEGFTSPLSLLGTYQYVNLGILSAPVTVVWIMAMINAINWLDGLDGLVAGVAALAGLTIMAGAWSGSAPVFIGVAAAAVAGSCLGFLPFNFNPARIFMGDTGAMFLGYILACISVLGPFKSTTAIALFVPLLVLGVPIFDTVTGIIRRLAAGKSPLAADRGHIHHRLLDRGLSTRQAVLFIYALTGLLCGLALELWRA